MSSFSAQVSAAPYVQRLTQYGHSAWHVQDGLFGSPNGITQTKDGYLWIGTDAGLVRFDGVRFVPWNDFPDGSIATWAVDRVLAARDGSLWISGAGRVAQVMDRRISRYTIVGRAIDMVEDDNGAIWFARTRVADGTGPICRANRGKVDCYGKPDLPLALAGTVNTSSDGGFWLGGSSALCHWSPGQVADCYLQDALKPLNGLVGVNAVFSARDGTLWVGTARAGKDLGLGKLVRGKWEPVKADGLDSSTLRVISLFEDREGSMWVGTSGQGLYRIRSGRAEHFGTADGLSGSKISDIYEDREGTVWVCTSGGIDSFRRLAVAVFSSREGLPVDSVDAVLPARDGSVWIGSSVLSRLVDDEPTPPPEAQLFQQRTVTSLLEDSSGRMWIGLERTLNVFSHGELKPVKSAGGDDLGVVTLIAEDSHNDIWAATAPNASRTFRIRDTTVAEEFDSKSFGAPLAMAPDQVNGMWFGYNNGAIAHYHDGQLEMFAADSVTGGPVRALLPQVDGMILAASARGLLVKRGSSRLLLDTAHGLPCDRLTAVLRDLKNAVWLSSGCGLIEIADAEFARWLALPSSRIQYRLFDETDGVQSGNADFSPGAKMGRDGRLWFATTKVAQMIDPAEVSAPETPPMVRIEQVTADRKVFAADPGLTLPVRTRDMEIQYTALSFRVPQKIKFKYQLEGRDETWIEAGTRRAAFYTDLPPGRYRFRVIACNSEGIWNNEGASLSFDIPPIFYQTRWFAALCIAAAIALLYLLYLARLRQVAARIRDRLVAKNAERERIARELHDTLLQSTQGLILRVEAATKQLPAGNSVRAALESTLQRANEVMSEGRDRVQDLRISDTLSRNLVRSLSSVGEELAREYKIEFRAVVDGQPQDLERLIVEDAYAIGREALLNAFTHAQARLVEAQVIYSEIDFRLRFRDDGRGIDTDLFDAGRPGHWGIKGMRERAQKIGGELQVWSRPSAGLEIELRVPATLAYTKPRSRYRWLNFGLHVKQ
jgi:signal transduction histidine kinase/ligand-binding sensor domain-containing protein